MSKARDLASGQNGIRPYATSANAVSLSGTSVGAGTYASTTVTFPASRFTIAPTVTVTLSNAPGGTQYAVARSNGASTTGFTLLVYNVGSTAITWTSGTFDWHAIQMTSASAGG